VQDDGIGFDPQQPPSVLGGGLGLIGIRERLQPIKAASKCDPRLVPAPNSSYRSPVA